MSRQQILDRERRWALPAGLAAVIVAPLFIAATALDPQNGTIPFGGVDTEQYRAIHENAGPLVAAAVVRGIALLLMTVPLVYLFRAAQARSTRVSSPMIGFAVLGPLLFAVQSVLFSIAQTHVASDFVSQAAGGGDIYNLLDDLIDDSSLYEVAISLFIPAGLGLLVAMVYTSLQAMRVGLLTRFIGTLGMALGVATVIISPLVTLVAIALWVAWLGLLILDRSPRGRPPAWEAGEAIPWPRPGEEPAAAAATSNGTVEGDASEIFEPPETSDNAARRERAKKRKRKRRR